MGSIVLAIYLFTRFNGGSSGGTGRSRCVLALQSAALHRELTWQQLSTAPALLHLLLCSR